MDPLLVDIRQSVTNLFLRTRFPLADSAGGDSADPARTPDPLNKLPQKLNANFQARLLSPSLTRGSPL